MSSDPPVEKKAKPIKSCLWLGFKAVLFSGLLALIILVIFHQPLLRYALDKVGRHFAAKAGLTVDWTMNGSVVSALGLQGVHVQGEKGLVRKLHWQSLDLEYNIPAFWKTGLADVINKISLQDADLELDLRRDPTAQPKPPKEPKEKAGLPDIWVGNLDLKNVSVRLKMDGGDIVIRGLTWQLSEGVTGKFYLDELIIPSAKIHLHQVEGVSKAQGRAIILEQVSLREGVTIDNLTANLFPIRDGDLPLALDLRTREGRITVSGLLTGLGQKFGLDLQLSVLKISDRDVALWAPMPENIHWLAEHGAAKVKGYPAEPQKLDFDLALEGRNIQAAGQKLDQALLLGSNADQGKLHIKDLFVFSQENLVAANGQAQLPARWSDMKQTAAEVNWSAYASRLESFKPDADIAGGVIGDGAITLKDGRLTSADGLLQGYNLQVQGSPAAQLRAEVETNGDVLTISSLRLWWDAQHELSAKGALQLSGGQATALTWSLQLPEAGRFTPEALKQKLGEPFNGEVRFNGEANFLLADVKAKNFTPLQATAELQVSNFIWKESHLLTLDLQARANNGKLNITDLTAQFEGQNRLRMAGQAALDMKGPFDGTVRAEFSELAKLNPWLSLAKMPVIESGALSINWKAGGTMNREQLSGGGELSVKDVVVEGRTERINLALEAEHSGLTAEVKKLEASAGPWRANGSLKLTEEELLVPSLTIQSGDLKLLNMKAEVPLALKQQPRPKIPLDYSKPWLVDIQMEELNVGQIGDVAGFKVPLRAEVNGSIKVSGSAGKPVAELDLTLNKAVVDAVKDKLDPADFKLRVNLKEDILQASAEYHQKPLKPLTVEAQAPLNLEEVLEDPKSLLDAPLQAKVNLPASELTLVRRFVPALKTLTGTVMTEVNIGGVVKSPQWQGQLLVNVTDAEIESLPMNFRALKVHLLFDQSTVRLHDVFASVAGGEARLSGEVEVNEISNPQFDLRLEAREALVMRDQTMSLRTDGRLTCQGTLKKATLAGRLDLVRGRVFKEVEFLPLSLPNQLPPAPPPVTRSERKLELPPLLKDWSFDVQVRTRDPIRLLGNVLNGGVVVQINAGGTGASPELDGKVTLTGARVQLPFSRLAITKGEITFNKDNPFDPQIDLQGDSFVNNYQVTLYAYGPALAPKLRFTSSPPLSEAEIATLLATGATTGDLRSSEGVAANRAAFLLISQTYRKLFRKTAPRRYDEEPPKLSFSFSPLSTGRSERSVSATYEISPKLQAVGIVGERGSFRGLLYYLVRFR